MVILNWLDDIQEGNMERRKCFGPDWYFVYRDRT